MKIIFPTVISHSGSDVYFDLLTRTLPLHGMTTSHIPLSHRHEFIPFLTQAEQQAISAGDIIHTAVEQGSLVYCPHKPLILTAHHNVIDPEYQNYTSPLQKLFHRHIINKRQARSLLLAARIICVSESTRLSYARTYPECAGKLQVIYNGIDLGRFKPAGAGNSASSHTDIHTSQRLPRTSRPPTSSSLLFVGHLTQRKGVDLLPEIMDQLGQGHELTCVGKRNARMKVRMTPSGARINVLPSVSQDELIALYQKSDLLLFPSRLEGFGYAVAEAMACGKPVVATNCSSIPELIDHGQGGILCPTDKVSAFADGVRKILSEPNLAATMGAYNRAKAERLFSLERMIEQYAEMYRQMIE